MVPSDSAIRVNASADLAFDPHLAGISLDQGAGLNERGPTGLNGVRDVEPLAIPGQPPSDDVQRRGESDIVA